MQAVEKTMHEWIASLGDKQISQLFLDMGTGKRLRAKLVMLIAGQSENAIRLAAVIELIHAASLLHDDVIDDASLRRNKASVNALHGDKTAIMMGDILYSKAYSELALLGEDITQNIANAVTKLSLGELQDVRLAQQFNTHEDDYIQMIYNKTASLIEATCQSAAQLVNKPHEAYALYGKNLGLAFQIIDDILDITSDEATLGKPVLNDFVEGKATLPYIYLYQVIDDKARLEACHGKKLSSNEHAWLLAKLKEHDTIGQSYALAKALSDEGKRALNDEDALIDVLDQLLKRAF